MDNLFTKIIRYQIVTKRYEKRHRKISHRNEFLIDQFRKSDIIMLSSRHASAHFHYFSRLWKNVDFFSIHSSDWRQRKRSSSFSRKKHFIHSSRKIVFWLHLASIRVDFVSWVSRFLIDSPAFLLERNDSVWYFSCMSGKTHSLIRGHTRKKWASCLGEIFSRIKRAKSSCAWREDSPSSRISPRKKITLCHERNGTKESIPADILSCQPL